MPATSPIELAVQNMPKRRRRRVRPARFPRGIERQYEATALDIEQAKQNLVRELLIERLPELARLAGLRADTDRIDQSPWRALLRIIMRDIEQRHARAESFARQAAQDTAQQMSVFNRSELARQVRSAIGFDIFAEDPGLIDLLEQFEADNVSHIVTTSPQNFATIERVVSQGFQSGQRASTIADALVNVLGVQQSRAMFWARDQIGSLNSQLTRARQTALGIDQYVWHTSMDEAVRESHRQLEGTIHSWDDPPTVGKRQVHPGEDYNCRCLDGITVLNGLARLKRLYRRVHHGAMCVVTFSSGISLRATPNHPVLTRRGLQPIESLNLGDDVIAEVEQAGDVLEFNGQRHNITIAQLFAAFDKAFVARTIPGQLARDFHGDATDEKIDLVTVDGELVNKWFGVAAEQCRKLGLTNADQMAVIAFLRRSKPRDTGPARAAMSRLDLTLSLLRRHLTPLDFLCLALGPDFDAGSRQSESDAGAGCVESLRDCVLACTRFIHGNDFLDREIAAIRRGAPLPLARIHPASTQVLREDIGPDANSLTGLDECRTGRYQLLRVVDKTVGDFSGHVYNLQTSNGLYIASTTIVGNCTPDPVIPGVSIEQTGPEDVPRNPDLVRSKRNRDRRARDRAVRRQQQTPIEL